MYSKDLRRRIYGVSSFDLLTYIGRIQNIKYFTIWTTTTTYIRKSQGKTLALILNLVGLLTQGRYRSKNASHPSHFEHCLVQKRSEKED